jgi:hypothetical protein
MMGGKGKRKSTHLGGLDSEFRFEQPHGYKGGRFDAVVHQRRNGIGGSVQRRGPVKGTPDSLRRNAKLGAAGAK